jgi:MFS family permease
VLLGAGRAFPFAADAASYLVSLAGVLLVRSSLQDPASQRPRRRVVAEVFEGMRWLWRRPFFRAVLLWMTLEAVAFSSIGLVILVLARSRGASPADLGGMFALTSAGGVAGAFAAPRLVRRFSPRALVLAFAWTGAGATVALQAARSPYAIGALGAAAFFFSPSLSAFLFGAIADHCPDELLGRANSAAIQLGSLATPVGPLVAGALLGALGPSHTVLVYAAWLVALAIGATLNRGVREDIAAVAT